MSSKTSRAQASPSGLRFLAIRYARSNWAILLLNAVEVVADCLPRWPPPSASGARRDLLWLSRAIAGAGSHAEKSFLES
jgi:hypothetical protein